MTVNSTTSIIGGLCSAFIRNTVYHLAIGRVFVHFVLGHHGSKCWRQIICKHAHTHTHSPHAPVPWGRKFPPTPHPLSSLTFDPGTCDLLVGQSSFALRFDWSVWPSLCPELCCPWNLEGKDGRESRRRREDVEGECETKTQRRGANVWKRDAFLCFPFLYRRETKRTMEWNKCGGQKTNRKVFISPCLHLHSLPPPILPGFPSRCPLSGCSPQMAGRKRKGLLPVFVLAGMQWGWAACVFRLRLQIMTCRGLGDLWSLWPISQRKPYPTSHLSLWGLAHPVTSQRNARGKKQIK